MRKKVRFNAFTVHFVAAFALIAILLPINIEVAFRSQTLSSDHSQANTVTWQSGTFEIHIFDDVRQAFMRSHTSTVVMYWILFFIGVIAIIISILLALIPNQILAGAIFAGLGVVSFIGYFITCSTQSVEENLIYIT